MKHDNINYLVVGGFVLTMVAVLLVSLYKITGRTGRMDTYFAHYNNVSGLKYGTRVLYEGYPIGQVEEIIPRQSDGKTLYKVVFQVQKDWQIPQDSIASVGSAGLIPAGLIAIQAGDSKTILGPGSEIRGQEPANMLAVMNEIATDMRELTTTQLRPMIALLHKRVEDPELFAHIKGLLANMDNNTERLQAFLSDENQQHVASILNKMDSTAGGMNASIQGLEVTRGRVDKLLVLAEGLLVDHGQTLATTIDDTGGSAADMRKTISVVSEHIEAVMSDLESMTRNMREFSRELRENPAMVLTSSPQADKGAD